MLILALMGGLGHKRQDKPKGIYFIRIGSGRQARPGDHRHQDKL